MNSGAVTDRELRLLRLPWVAALDYEHKKEASKLIQRGIDETLLHFWYNVRNGCYTDLPATVLQKDIERMRATYPQFADDILNWKS